MTTFQVINFVVSALVCLYILGIVAFAYFYHDTTGRILVKKDDGRYSLSSTGWAISLWGGWWLTLFILYVFIGTRYFALVALLSALGDLATLGAVIAFCRGSRFSYTEIIPLSFVVALVVVWCLSVSTLRQTPQGMLIAIGPLAVLSTTSAIALGWAVIVRCGWRSAPFAVLTLLYAFIQPAAYVSEFVLDLPVLQTVRNEYFYTIARVFGFLAFGKVLIAISFLGYFFSPELDYDKLKEERYWPTATSAAKMHPSFARVLKVVFGYFGSIALGLLTGLVTAIIKPEFVETIRNLFR